MIQLSKYKRSYSDDVHKSVDNVENTIKILKNHSGKPSYAYKNVQYSPNMYYLLISEPLC